MKKSTVNQKQGPRTGNQGNPAKRSAFLEASSRGSSYQQSIADMVMEGFARRGREHAGYLNPALEPVSANTRTRRGPTRGNG